MFTIDGYQQAPAIGKNLTGDDDSPMPSGGESTSYAGDEEESGGWMRRARDAYLSSTTYIDSNYRLQWEDSIRAFNSEHPASSKYNSPSYSKRSKVFRPKTRSIIRKIEAASASAFFSNMDIMEVRAVNQADKKEQASAEILNELLTYRLTNSVPWYLFVQGGIQDAQVVGVACAYLYWDYVPADEEEENASPEDMEEEYPKQDDQQTNEATNGAVVPEGGSMPIAGSISGNALPATTQAKMGDSTPPPASPTPQQMPMQTPQQASKPRKKKPKVDKPCVELIPIENIRIDMAAKWDDPVNSSPYLIHMMPMYVCDIEEKMDKGEWFHKSRNMISNAMRNTGQSTTITRGQNKEDPYTQNQRVSDYEICWIQRHIHRYRGEDWIFYTLGDLCLLTDPKPLKEEYFHGMRPFVIGSTNLETHKTFPNSECEITKGLQEETNEICNQRLDNVKFVLNKKWFTKNSAQVDIAALVRNVPGGVVMMNNPETDVKEINFQDVTGSSFEEQNRLNADFDELSGNFSAASLTTNDQALTSPMRTMQMLNQGANILTEYKIRTYVETFILPVLKMLIKLEQYYETDEVLLAIASQKLQLFQRFGVDKVTDDLLMRDLTVIVNVGMGATDPSSKVQKFIAGVGSYAQIVKAAIPGLNVQEIGKEIFGHLGYQDGTRFLTNGNPREQQLQQGLQQALQMAGQFKKQLKDKEDANKINFQKAQLAHDAQLKKIAEDFAKAQLEHRGKLQEIDLKHRSEMVKLHHSNLQLEHNTRQTHQQTQQNFQNEMQKHAVQSQQNQQGEAEGKKQMLGTISKLEEELKALKAEMKAPKVVKRDGKGRAIAINDRRIARDERGSITGLE